MLAASLWVFLLVSGTYAPGVDRISKEAENRMYGSTKDTKRREKFHEYEMGKELKYRASLENASSDEERKTLEEKELQHHERKHEKLHEPLQDAQLREVWEKSDGLDPDFFDLRTLFKLHDKDNNSFLDEFELETLFLTDLEKAYPEDDPDTDPAERDEEMNRMREYAMKNVDANKDGKLSLDEVVQAKSSGSEHEDEEEWHPLYGSKEFTEDELNQYKEKLGGEKVASQ